MDETIIAQAIQALQADSYADFASQSAHLRQWLEHLPVLSARDLDQQRPVEQATTGGLDEIMAFINSKWRAYNPPNSHEGAISALFSAESDRLTVTFHSYFWGMTAQQSGLSVARTGPNAYLFWSFF